MTQNRWAAWSLGMLMICSAAFGQQKQKPDPKNFRPHYGVRPLKGAGNYADQIRLQGATGMTIPLWSYSVTSPVDGHQYSGMIVGRAPYYHGHRATTVPTEIIPVTFTFDDSGVVFDPTTPDSCLGNRTIVDVVKKSPIFQTVNWVMNGVNVGSTQYEDAFQRAEFWQFVAGTPQHTLMGLTVRQQAVQVEVPTAYGETMYNPDTGCYLGLLDYDAWDSYLQSTLIPSLSNEIGPASFPIFLSNSVVEYDDGNPDHCCTLGYHGAFMSNGLLQTYTTATLDDSGFTGGDDLTVMSHEVSEWMNDPAINNPTPAWGHTGQVSGCQNNFETGDPLSPGFGTPTNEWEVTLNGFTYHLQELAFFSWFYRGASFGAGGKYSDNLTFTTDAGPVCQ